MTKSRMMSGCLGLSLALSALGGACSTGNTDAESNDPATDEMIRQLQDELARAPAVSASYRQVKPVLKCVEKVNSTTYKAHFGYTSSASMPLTIPVGFFNRFWPGAINRGQSTTFNPGTFADVVQVPFNSYSASVWLLGTSLRAFRPAHWLLQKVTLFPAAAWFETTNAPARRNAKVMVATLAEAA